MPCRDDKSSPKCARSFQNASPLAGLRIVTKIDGFKHDLDKATASGKKPSQSYLSTLFVRPPVDSILPLLFWSNGR